MHVIKKTTLLAHRQRGVAALGMSLLTVAVAGAALGSALLYQSKNAQSHAWDQRHAILWAQQAVQDFMTAHGRLPCPAASRAGAEDCTGGGGKGWLPVASLLSTAGTRLPPAHDSMAMRYLVNRGAGSRPQDLAASGALYQPEFSPGKRPAAYPKNLIGTMDACERLWTAQQGGDFAYGVAVAAPGAPVSASGINADFTQGSLEPPGRGIDALYRDRVAVRTAREVYEEVRCGETSASLDAMAVAATWVEATLDVQQANVERGETNAQINTLGVMSDGFYLVDSTADLSNGVHNLANNALKKGIASSNPFLWPLVPVHAGGMSKALLGIALSAVDTARNAGTLAIRAGQVQAFRNMSRAAIEQPVWQGALGMLALAQETGIAAPLPPLTALDALEP